MKYFIDASKGPIYLQLYNQLREDIVSGIYPYNSKLPSKRNLAEETGVSTITVEHAYALLCDEGYAEGRARSGFVVIFQKANGFASTEKSEYVYRTHYHKEHSSFDFPLSVLSKTMRKVLTENGEILLEKPQNSGTCELRGAIKKYLARNRGINVDIEQIVIGSGSEYLYGLIVELLGRGRIF